MKIKLTLLTVACAFALSACGEQSQPPSATVAPATPTAPVAPTPPPAPEPVVEPAPVAAAETPATDGKSAVVTDCATEIDGNDAMQYNLNSITVPASCAEFKITLHHVGKLPEAAMGHNVVITKLADKNAVVADAMTAGAAAGYLKADDDRVIAHTDMIGGGESTSVSFAVSKIQGDGPYEFFCSFPGHAVMMHGTINVE